MLFVSTLFWLMSMMIIFPLSSTQTPPPAPSTQPPPAPSTQPPPAPATQPPTTAEDHAVCGSFDPAQCKELTTSILCPNLCAAAGDPQECSIFEAGQCREPISKQCPNLCTPAEDPQVCFRFEAGQCEEPISKQCPNLCTPAKDPAVCASIDPAQCKEVMTSLACPKLCAAEEDPQVCSRFEAGQCEETISKQCPNLCTPVEDSVWCFYVDTENCGAPMISRECPNLCTGVRAKVDGQWSSWGSWGSCSVSCGGGTKQRSRLCDDPSPDNGGLDCTGLPTEDENCGTNPCPIDGGWSEWSDWGPCSAACGGGQRQQNRVCDSPTPAHGGQVCAGSKNKVDNCNTDDCGPPRCPTGFKLVGPRQCLMHVTQEKTWTMAEAACKWNGGTGLAYLEHTDYTLVKPMITGDRAYTWVGARKYPDGNYQWSSTRTTVTNWQDGQPTYSGSDNCVLVYNTDGEYRNNPCSRTTPFLCEAAPVISG